MKHNFFHRYGKLSLYLTVLLASILVVTSCTGSAPVQDDWGQRYRSEKYGFSFTYPEDMVIKTEKARNDVVTLHLEKSSGNDMQLIISVAQAAFSQEELASESYRLLSASLYRLQSIEEKGVQEIAGRQVTMIEALAGEKEKIKAGIAAFSADGRSFYMTIITLEENYEAAVDHLYMIIASADSK